MSVFEVRHGTSPVILAMPHTGTDVPSEIWERLNDNGRQLIDTDWYIHNLYDGLLEKATVVRAMFHRYVIDANRDPEGASLYPGQNTTGLIPKTDFDGEAIWKSGAEPTDDDIAQRVATFHSPYHTALQSEIERVKAIHGLAIVYDCHSIRSHIPFLFEGTLPDFNIGTNDGQSCHPAVAAAVVNVVRNADGYTRTLNGRFKGGWTTRHYGTLESGVHAIQMELAQSTHLSAEEPPFSYDTAKAERIRARLRDILTNLERAASELKK
ncbi:MULTISPECIES: N-formylglutamate deformylase [Rhizobium/Agrobacterium group]|nr:MULTISPECIES: N-formylglutamate deformylase [Rhizobium/Agrobacterium group]AQS65516.1 N-formylglutamate deformylase [Rhizobium rhizogenes]ASK42060.1 N-formylglutamate deformylase [Rhizobium rhizogenes]MCZ7445903.1 N-formylglutamate deformylase [Rhizobium rhizogenes]MCZ7472671.1 N-formylglutamate deformylase [Rhizobium rhizogenes]MCZ7484114.1 N-formylglutamate deformylase [Rhizobium rhizogenes]